MNYPHNHDQLDDEDPTSHPLRADALTGPYYGLPPPEIFHLRHSADTNTEQLVEEERQLYLGALRVRALLNARATINCLPVELLIEIIQAAQEVNGLEVAPDARGLPTLVRSGRLYVEALDTDHCQEPHQPPQDQLGALKEFSSRGRDQRQYCGL